MKYIISGTNRPGSRTLMVAKYVQSMYSNEGGEKVELIDLATVGLEHLGATAQYGDAVPPVMKAYVDKISAAEGLIVVCPEYNGSMPGALKYFIDHWKYPDSYEFRPISLIGLSATFGAVRPVEHLQIVFGYRNAYIYPERVFVMEAKKAMNTEGAIIDEKINGLLRSQMRGFQAFTKALAHAGLDANSKIEARKKAAAPART
jgi:NAD(P)H-dependent FMN reductase